jgi:hypothetical protein
MDCEHDVISLPAADDAHLKKHAAAMRINDET